MKEWWQITPHTKSRERPKRHKFAFARKEKTRRRALGRFYHQVSGDMHAAPVVKINPFYCAIDWIINFGLARPPTDRTRRKDGRKKVATMSACVPYIFFLCVCVWVRECVSAEALCVLIVSYFLTQSLFSLSHIIRPKKGERAHSKRLTWWSEFDCVPQEWSKNFAAASPPLLLPHDFSSQRKRDRVYFPSELPLLLYHNHLLLAGWEREQWESERQANPPLSCWRGLSSANSLFLPAHW